MNGHSCPFHTRLCQEFWQNDSVWHLSSLLKSNHEHRFHQLILMRGAYFLKKKARIPIIKGFEQDYYLLSSSYLIAEISFNSVITDRWRVVQAF